MLNPYDTRPVWDNRFVGRKGILDELLSSPANSLIIGTSRIGKTSLLRHLQWLLDAQRIPAFCISLKLAGALQELAPVICRVLETQKSRFDFAGIGLDLNQFRQADCSAIWTQSFWMLLICFQSRKNQFCDSSARKVH